MYNIIYSNNILRYYRKIIQYTAAAIKSKYFEHNKIYCYIVYITRFPRSPGAGSHMVTLRIYN